MTAHTLAQSPPPASPQPLPTEIQGLLANWISIGLGFVAVASVVFMGWALVEISQAREVGREPKQGVERLLVIAVVLMFASSIGAVVSLIYTPI
ncbi:hypothetical protein BFG51_03780 [Dietzia alimentaria]|jgi:hypothetical protein|uniref:hypothetical protein n=1 Tax=Mycobacteriales TaxID=85007 RepID=UPI0008487660|nr:MULTISPECIES: hypothetical protein [Mycobacteriales]ODQ94576.1 hypothetical protein BFG51_03780 [Dietzia alimentaria]PWD95589.1 hypothetical protein DEQ16_09990 [Dietzia maris]PZT89861.1 MAG: hypothetical protein DI630_31970 [Gordonia sp. (in: high G+C Gram-positive bacteria)]MBB1049758.1 hypothetical protein [Dietzia sp. CW19]MBB1056951.1 hypothetical protein [Dietzia sp. B19]